MRTRVTTHSFSSSRSSRGFDRSTAGFSESRSSGSTFALSVILPDFTSMVVIYPSQAHQRICGLPVVVVRHFCELRKHTPLRQLRNVRERVRRVVMHQHRWEI